MINLKFFEPINDEILKVVSRIKDPSNRALLCGYAASVYAATNEQEAHKLAAQAVSAAIAFQAAESSDSGFKYGKHLGELKHERA
jgi:hypothetical protein